MRLSLRAARTTRSSSSPSRPSRSAPQWKQNSASDSNDSLILPLTASAAALQHGDEEAVGAVAQGRHLQRLGGGVGCGDTWHPQQRLLPELRPGNELELSMAGKKSVHLIAI